MKKMYQSPEAEVILLSSEDVISTSVGDYGSKKTENDMKWDRR